MKLKIIKDPARQTPLIFRQGVKCLFLSNDFDGLKRIVFTNKPLSKLIRNKLSYSFTFSHNEKGRFELGYFYQTFCDT